MRIIWVLALLIVVGGCRNEMNGQRAKQNDNEYLNISSIENQKSNNRKTITLEKIPYAEFKDRWNALADEMDRNLHINELIYVDDPIDPYFQCLLQDQMEVRAMSDGEGIVKIQFISKSSKDHYKMLTGWIVVYQLLKGEDSQKDGDALLATLGVGPNENLENINESTLLYEGINYRVSPYANGYLFEASYPKDL
ncbi:hypothetical protein LS684_18750 [Cytobacillus spongiae]|uniref:hypothetical protein n=1 Tax=Cytobacillus spongiae TaxID=2901381 RepID=UPI001F29CE8A|nr:hypothetical protein [Cytobacillus spongiae]UII55640.1 hypothetical protein LS684_18750 [Cytobacillus spongiae]